MLLAHALDHHALGNLDAHLSGIGDVNLLGRLAQANLGGGHVDLAVVGIGLGALKAEVLRRDGSIELRDLPALVALPRTAGGVLPIRAILAVLDAVTRHRAVVARVLAGQVAQGLDGRRLRQLHLDPHVLLGAAIPMGVVLGVDVLIKGELDRALAARLGLVLAAGGVLGHLLDRVIARRVVVRQGVAAVDIGGKVDGEHRALRVVLGLEEDLDLVVVRRQNGHRGVVLRLGNDLRGKRARGELAGCENGGAQLLAIHRELRELSGAVHRVGGGCLDELDLGDHGAGLGSARLVLGRVRHVHANERRSRRRELVAVLLNVRGGLGGVDGLLDVERSPAALGARL